MTAWVRFSLFSDCNKVLTLPQTDGGKTHFMNMSRRKICKKRQFNSVLEWLNKVLNGAAQHDKKHL
jgi:hypothetical protein